MRECEHPEESVTWGTEGPAIEGYAYGTCVCGELLVRTPQP